jgi:hypothetical protein
MRSALWASLMVYFAGVVWGLVKVDARAVVRIALSLAWPVGPIAFVVTLTVLLLAAAIAFPLFAATFVAGATAWWFLA